MVSELKDLAIFLMRVGKQSTPISSLFQAGRSLQFVEVVKEPRCYTSFTVAERSHSNRTETGFVTSRSGCTQFRLGNLVNFQPAFFVSPVGDRSSHPHRGPEC